MSTRFEDDDAPRGDEDRSTGAADVDDMADPARDADDQAGEDAAVDEVVDAQEAAPPKKKRNPLPFIAGGAVVALGVLGGVGFMLMRGGAPAPIESVALAPMGEPARTADSGMLAQPGGNPPPAGMLSSAPGDAAPGAAGIQPGQPMAQPPASAVNPMNPGAVAMPGAPGAAPVAAAPAVAAQTPGALPAGAPPVVAAPATTVAQAPAAAPVAPTPAAVQTPAQPAAVPPSGATPPAGGLAPMGAPAKPVATKPMTEPAASVKPAQEPAAAVKVPQERKRVVAQAAAQRKAAPNAATPRRPAGGGDKDTAQKVEAPAMVAAAPEADSPVIARLNLRAVYPAQGPDMQAWVMDGDTMTVVSRGSLIAGAKVLEVRPGAVVTDRGTIR